MNQFGGVTARKALVLLGVFIVVGGFALGLLSNTTLGSFGTFTSSPAAVSLPVTQYVGNGSNYQGNSVSGFGGGLAPSNPTDTTQVIATATMTTTMTGSGSSPGGAGGFVGNGSQGAPSSGGGLLEFSSQLTLTAASPEETASAVVALAYSVGGYVAYQSTYTSSAYVVIRVPASDYQQVLNQVRAMGKVASLTSNSNDVSVQYTDLNASLVSFQTEQAALLRLLNQSTSINSTLAIENQLQSVNSQINQIQSEILQTRTLISYATIDVTINVSPQNVPLTLSLSATPRSGTAPLSVTFNSVVKGGAQPYVVNYNFGDGYSAQGGIVIHTFEAAGDYNVTVSVTDQNGTVALASTMVKVTAVAAQNGVNTFLGTVGGLLVGVVEGIVEVAVVVLPIAGVGAAVLIPFRRRSRGQKPVRQTQ